MADPALPHHLPKRRPDGKPGDPTETWPRQRAGTTPQMIGRYPDYDVLSEADAWDDATRTVVLARLDPPGPLRFFSPDEEPTVQAFCDLVTWQHAEPRVPVVAAVDTKLADGRLDGFQYADMPDDRDTWHLVLAGLEHTAQQRHGRAFAHCGLDAQEAIVDDFSHGDLGGGPWDRLNVSRAWSVVMRAVLEGFYAHPWAWNEIGFGGPAYPRGFMRLGPTSTLEPWESPGAGNEDPVPVAQQIEQRRQADEGRR